MKKHDTRFILLSIAVTVFVVHPVSAQAFSRFAGMTGVNNAFRIGDSGFQAAVEEGIGGDVALAVGFGKRWRAWLEGGGFDFPFDVRRFYDGLGLYGADPSGYIEPSARLRFVMTGVDFSPWFTDWFIPYARLGVGFWSQSKGLIPWLTSLYCQEPSAATPIPAYCTQALSELPVNGSHVGYQMGFGIILWSDDNYQWFADIRFLGPVGSNRISVLPGRVGFVFPFLRSSS